MHTYRKPSSPQQPREVMMSDAKAYTDAEIETARNHSVMPYSQQCERLKWLATVDQLKAERDEATRVMFRESRRADKAEKWRDALLRPAAPAACPQCRATDRDFIGVDCYGEEPPHDWHIRPACAGEDHASIVADHDCEASDE